MYYTHEFMGPLFRWSNYCNTLFTNVFEIELILMQDEDYFLPDEEDMDVSMGISVPGADADKMDFLQYSISPGFKKWQQATLDTVYSKLWSAVKTPAH